MLFPWNEQTVRFMADAAEYTGFYEKLADSLLPLIPKRESLCDIGCGLALADFTLVKSIGSITCVDINSEALSFVRRHAEAEQVKNLTVLQSDGMALEGSWGTVTAMFHNSVVDICANYLSKAKDRLILITHSQKSARRKCCNTAETVAWLDAGGWSYDMQEEKLEFGQPFRSHQEAEVWRRVFMPDLSTEKLSSRLVPTERMDFPLYLPKKREFGIFVIPRKANEESLKREQNRTVDSAGIIAFRNGEKKQK